MPASFLRQALLAAALLLAVQPEPPRVGLSAFHADRSCKPFAPLAVTVMPRGDGSGPHVTLDAGIRPVLEMQGVTWHWELSPDVQRLDGALQGVADGTRGALTQSTLDVQVPVDGRYARAVLVVSGSFTGQDEQGQAVLERVEVAPLVSWGERPLPGPLVSTLDGETGAPVEMIAVPCTLQSGR
jgi:hypothetical protein